MLAIRPGNRPKLPGNSRFCLARMKRTPSVFHYYPKNQKNPASVTPTAGVDGLLWDGTQPELQGSRIVCRLDGAEEVTMRIWALIDPSTLSFREYCVLFAPWPASAVATKPVP